MIIKSELERLEKKYGIDFRKKLSLYKTAKWNGQSVSLCEVDPKILICFIKDSNGKYHNVSVTDLDDFVL